MAKVISNSLIAPNIFCLEVEYSALIKPGQFFMLRAWHLDPLLSRPISVYDVTSSSVKFLIAKIGKGTKQLALLKPNDQLQLLGPLGNGFQIKAEKCALVGGGIGIAPLLLLAKQLPIKPDLFVGFKDNSFELDKFAPYVNKIIVTTESGKEGIQGRVTDVLKPYHYDTIYTCGPTLMMQAVVNLSQDTPVFASLERHMACGFGACLGCSIKTKAMMKRVCVEGPVFNGKELFNVND